VDSEQLHWNQCDYLVRNEHVHYNIVWNPLVCQLIAFRLQRFCAAILEKINSDVLEVSLAQDVHIASVQEGSHPYKKEYFNIAVEPFKVCLYPLSMMHVSVSSLIWLWLRFSHYFVGILVLMFSVQIPTCIQNSGRPSECPLSDQKMSGIPVWQKDQWTTVTARCDAVVLVPIGTMVGQSVQQSILGNACHQVSRSLLLTLGRVWPGWA